MNTEVQTTDNNISFVSNDATAQNAFWKAILGKTVDIDLVNNTSITMTVCQVDQYNLIGETEDEGFVMLAKAAIVAVYPENSAEQQVAIVECIAKGYKSIQYKKSEARTKYNSKKLDNTKGTRPRRPQPDHYIPNRQYSEASAAPAPTIIVKKKRTIEMPS